MSGKKISYYDLRHVPQQALMKQYKMNSAQFEQEVRRHCRDASKPELENFYKDVYSRKEVK